MSDEANHIVYQHHLVIITPDPFRKRKEELFLTK